MNNQGKLATILLLSMTFWSVMVVNSDPAWAKKRVKAPEIYAATESEEDGSAPAPQLPTLDSDTDAATGIPKKPRKATLQLKTLKSHKAAPPSQIAQAPGTYDVVPGNQAESIARRLKLVEKMIRDHGRAYDYRLHTNQELESILAQLEETRAARQNESAPLPPPSSSPAMRTVRLRAPRYLKTQTE